MGTPRRPRAAPRQPSGLQSQRLVLPKASRAFAEPQQLFLPNSPDSLTLPHPRSRSAAPTSRQHLKVPGRRRSGTQAWPAAHRRRGRPAGGFHRVAETPREFPTPPHINPTSSFKFPPPGFIRRNAVLRLRPLLPLRVPAHLRLPTPGGTPLPRAKKPEGLRQVPPPARGRGRSSSSGPSSAVSVRGRCALGTGRRWLAPWLRLLSRRRLLLPVARAAGRSGVLVSDAAEV